MSKVIDAPSESSPETFSGDVNQGFTEFQAVQKNASVQAEEPAEVAPASEPAVIPPKQEPTPLTDEEKSAQKRANSERRWAERERELNATKAELERLKAEKAAPAVSATAKAKVVVPDDPADPKPKQDDFTDFDEYVDARSTWNARQVIKQDRERQATEAAEKTVRTHAETFMGKMDEYGKAHAGFIGTVEEPGAFETVRDGLESDLPAVSAAIVEHEQSAELIDYLGTHPEAFDRILALKGNPAKALIELGKIVAMEFDPAPVAGIKPQRKPLPKPPAAVSGRGHAPSAEAALDAAADAGDFAAAQRIFAAQRKAERG